MHVFCLHALLNARRPPCKRTSLDVVHRRATRRLPRTVAFISMCEGVRTRAPLSQTLGSLATSAVLVVPAAPQSVGHAAHQLLQVAHLLPGGWPGVRPQELGGARAELVYRVLQFPHKRPSRIGASDSSASKMETDTPPTEHPYCNSHTKGPSRIGVSVSSDPPRQRGIRTAIPTQKTLPNRGVSFFRQQTTPL